MVIKLKYYPLFKNLSHLYQCGMELLQKKNKNEVSDLWDGWEEANGIQHNLEGAVVEIRSMGPSVQIKTNSGFVPRMHSLASRKAVSVSCTDKGPPQPISAAEEHGESDNEGLSLAYRRKLVFCCMGLSGPFN